LEVILEDHLEDLEDHTVDQVEALLVEDRLETHLDLVEDRLEIHTDGHQVTHREVRHIIRVDILVAVAAVAVAAVAAVVVVLLVERQQEVVDRATRLSSVSRTTRITRTSLISPFGWLTPPMRCEHKVLESF
jgi:hypothetical protein